MRRADREDVTAQLAAADAARAELVDALLDLEDESVSARKAVRATRHAGTADLSALLGSFRQVQRAEEAHDLAALDLRTASGEDA